MYLTWHLQSQSPLLPTPPPSQRPLEPAAGLRWGSPPVFKRPQHFSCMPAVGRRPPSRPALDCALPHQRGPGDHTNVTCCWWSPAECFSLALFCFVAFCKFPYLIFNFCCFSFSLCQHTAKPLTRLCQYHVYHALLFLSLTSRGRWASCHPASHLTEMSSHHV